MPNHIVLKGKEKEVYDFILNEFKMKACAGTCLIRDRDLQQMLINIDNKYNHEEEFEDIAL
jgi:hypothetical protein